MNKLNQLLEEKQQRQQSVRSVENKLRYKNIQLEEIVSIEPSVE